MMRLRRCSIYVLVYIFIFGGIVTESTSIPIIPMSMAQGLEEPPPSANKKTAPPQSRKFWTQITDPIPLAPELNTGRLSDTLLSVIPGVVIHGFGHWHRGDLVSAKRTLFLEGLGILFILSGYTLETLSDQSSRSLYLGEQWLYHSGGALFLASWLADIVGSYRGDVSRQNLTRSFQPQTGSLGYRYRDDPRRTHNHHWVAELKYATSWLRMRGSLDWEFSGEVIGVEGSMMGTVYRDESIVSHFPSRIELGVRLRRWAWLADELTQWVITPEVEGTLNLELLSSGLKGYALFHRIGVGWEQFELTSNSTKNSATSTMIDYPLMMESGLKIQPYPNLALSISVLEDNTLDLRPINNNGLFFGAQVLLKQSDGVAVTINSIWGSDWSAWAMLTFNLGGER